MYLCVRYRRWAICLPGVCLYKVDGVGKVSAGGMSYKVSEVAMAAGDRGRRFVYAGHEVGRGCRLGGR